MLSALEGVRGIKFITTIVVIGVVTISIASAKPWLVADVAYLLSDTGIFLYES